MGIPLFLLVCAIWVANGNCKNLGNRTEGNISRISYTTASRTIIPTKVRIEPNKRTTTDQADIMSSQAPPSTVQESAGEKNLNIFEGKMTTIILIAVSSLLLFVVAVLSIVIVKMRRRIREISKHEEEKSHFYNNDTETPHRVSKTTGVYDNETTGVHDNETTDSREDSVKYDTPYAHQFEKTEILKKMVNDHADQNSANDRTYVTGHLQDNSLPSSPASEDEYIFVAGSSGYQIPQNARKMHSKHPEMTAKESTLKDGDDYVVLMAEQKTTEKKDNRLDTKYEGDTVHKGPKKKEIKITGKVQLIQALFNSNQRAASLATENRDYKDKTQECKG